MQDALTIRAATDHDLARICQLGDEINALHHQHAPEVFVAPTGADADKTWWQATLAATDGTVLVAQIDHEVIGFITAKVTNPPVPPFVHARKEGRIGTIVVTEAWRGRAVGERLLAAAKAWAKEQGAVTLYLQVFGFNEAAIRFYNKHGFATQSVYMNAPL